MTIKFQDPPTAAGGRLAKYMTPDLQAALRDRPGEWALVFAAVPERVRAALHAWVRRHESWEMTVRVAETGEKVWDIYLRYLGE